jgi:WD40 repeat protein/serine/threonine protein kinase
MHKIRAGDIGAQVSGRGKLNIRGYELREMVNDGHFAIVYRAYQPMTGRDVAIKAIKPQFANEPDFIRRFQFEAQLVARLEHPYIVPLYDFWREADGAFLVMRFMHGGSLRNLLQGGPLALPAALAYTDQVASALALAHQQGYIHRDIKPANILLDEANNAYLSDFGIVKSLSGATIQTQTGVIVGTPAYLSPEQALSKPVTPLSDQYSLAVTFYEMLTGRHAFDESSPARLIIKQINEPLPLVRASRPEMPAAIDECIQRATAKEPADRFPDIPAMLRALHVAAQIDGATYPLPVGFLEIDQDLINPYRGLRVFQEADAANFFGRSALIAKLLRHFDQTPPDAAVPPPLAHRFLAIVGPSGSGKSSVVKAGLIPALRRGEVPGSENWFIVEMVPGSHPLEELEAALLRIAVNPPASLLAQLQEDQRGLVRAVKRILPPTESELLLVIDQFEELYALVDDAEQRDHFINNLLTALAEPDSRLWAVITLRADFYDRPLMNAALAEVMRTSTEIVPPLTRPELQEVIVQPALQAGALFEIDLVPFIIDEVSEQPGALPLLQYTLTELFEQRQERLLTRSAYEEIGGVLGALGRRAEEMFLQLDSVGQEAARQLFMRLVTLGQNTENTRRRVLRSELTALASMSPAEKTPVGAPSQSPQNVAKIEMVIDAYGRYRLLTFDRDPVTREPTVEVAHEALFREWLRLRRWLDEYREDILLGHRLEAAAAEWVTSGREEAFLLRGSRLNQTEKWADDTTLTITPTVRAYLDASLAARRQREQAELARVEHEEAIERRSRNILRALVFIMALAAVIAAILAGTAIRAQRTAQSEAVARATQQAIAESETDARATQQALAERQANLATSRELAASALNQIPVDPERSILLASYALAKFPTLEVENALHRSIQSSRILLTLHGHAGPVYFTDYSPDGTRIATTGADGVAKIWDASTGQELLTLQGHKGDIFGIEFSPDGERLATASHDGTVIVWDAQTGERLLHLISDYSSLTAVHFSPDGKHLLANDNYDSRIMIWDAQTGEQLSSFVAHDAPTWYVTYSPQAQRLATASVDGTAKIWDANTNEELLTLDGHTDVVSRVSFSPDGQRLATSSMKVRIWDAKTGEEQLLLDGHSSLVLWVEFSPDGKRVATTSVDGKAKIWDAFSGEELFTLSGHSGVILGLAFSPDSTHLVTASYDGTARIWDVGPEKELLTIADRADRVYSIDFDPAGARLIGGSFDGTVRVWNIADPSAETFGQQLLSVGDTEPQNGVRAVAFSPDGARFIATNAAGIATVYDAGTGQVILTLEGHAPGQGGEITYNGITGAAFSADGSLIATASDDLTARIWNATSGRELFTLTGHVAASANVPPHEGVIDVAFSPSDKFAATAGADGTVKMWSLANGRLLLDHLAHPDSAVVALGFSPDGSRLATGAFDGTTTVWRVVRATETGESSALELKESFTLIGHTTAVYGVAFTPDSRRLATASEDGTAKVWDASSGQELLTLTVQSEGLLDVAITPDGKYLAAAGHDGAVRLFVLSTGELISLGHSRVTRQLSSEECQRYLHLDVCP